MGKLQLFYMLRARLRILTDVFEDFLFAPAETFGKIIQNPNEHYPCKPRPRGRILVPLHRLKLKKDNIKMYMKNNV